MAQVQYLPGLDYSCTNESLDAIMAGLDVQPQDRILAVAGSGDQAFAFLEIASHVKAVDTSLPQIKLVIQRAQQLREGNYVDFLNYTYNGCLDFIRPAPTYWPDTGTRYENAHKPGRSAYFANNFPSRLDKIRANLGNLEISEETADILKVAKKERGYNKIYLSNAIGYNRTLTDDKIRRIFSPLPRLLPADGLIYIANGGLFATYSLDSTLVFPGVELDKELTIKARELDGWRPAVYRKRK
nr:hypothetical protein [Nanoarchaeum sp.]